VPTPANIPAPRSTQDATLMYLAYGGDRAVQEAVFSIHSLLHVTGARRDFRVIVYTDRPDDFSGLPVDLEVLDQALLDEWTGDSGYGHRRKLMAMVHAATHHPGRTVFVDGDTWFHRSPQELFDALVPGTSLLHLLETRLLDSDDPTKHALSEHLGSTELRGLDERPLPVASNAAMWNSGVVGLHPRDSHLLRDALAVNDAIWSGFQDLHTVEQFAVGLVLEQRTRVLAADHVVFHYWTDELRKPFQQRLPELLAETAHLPLADRATALHRERPRPRGSRALKAQVKAQLRRAGRPVGAFQTSG
jgi:hypothetical protein